MKLAVLPHALFAALLALSAGSALAKSGATGTVTIDGEAWAVADAVATSADGDLEIVFSQHPFDRAKWADDGEFSTFDLFEFKDGADGQALKIDIDEEDGGYAGHNVRFSSSSSSGGFSSEHENSVTLTARDDTHVAGTVKLSEGDSLIADVAFDLPVTKTGPLARSGTPLPADGGEPGKALRATVDATHAGDLEKMLKLSHPERRSRLEEAKAAGEADKLLTMAKLFTPKISKITGGTTEGDNAWVEFEGQEGGSTVKGTAELTRFEGKWYIKGIKTRSGG